MKIIFLILIFGSYWKKIFDCIVNMIIFKSYLVSAPICSYIIWTL